MVNKTITKILASFEKKRTNLLPILHELNDTQGYIAKEDMQDIGDFLEISPTEIYGIATFYAFFNTEKKGKYIIRLCKSISCDLNNKNTIAKTIEQETKTSFGQTSKDKIFTLEYTNCMGMCDVGPAMMINKEIYTHLTPAKVKKVLAELGKKKKGKKAKKTGRV